MLPRKRKRKRKWSDKNESQNQEDTHHLCNVAEVVDAIPTVLLQIIYDYSAPSPSEVHKILQHIAKLLIDDPSLRDWDMKFERYMWGVFNCNPDVKRLKRLIPSRRPAMWRHFYRENWQAVEQVFFRDAMVVIPAFLKVEFVDETLPEAADVPDALIPWLHWGSVPLVKRNCPSSTHVKFYVPQWRLCGGWRSQFALYAARHIRLAYIDEVQKLLEQRHIRMISLDPHSNSF